MKYYQPYIGRNWKLFFSIAIGLTFSTATHAVDVDWANLGQANSTVLSSGSTVAATNNTCHPSATTCDVSATVTFELVNDGQGSELACGWGGNVCGAYFSDEFGGIPDENLRFAVDATGAADPDDYMNMCVQFDEQVEGLTFDILDIDDANWDDVVELYYTGVPSTTPMLNRTDLVNGFAFGDVTTGTDNNHVTPHNPSFPAPDNEALGWGAIQPGGGNANDRDDGGNVTINFGSTRVWGFCVKYWAGPNSSSNPPFQWIGLSALNWTSTLPVNLDFFTSSRRGNTIDVEWSTSTESFNVGFNLWGEVDGEWQALNRNLIPSKKMDSYSALSYKRKVKLNKTTQNVTRIGISSIDSQGQEEFYGPFEIGEDYGEQSVPEPIDWENVAAKKSEMLKAKGFRKLHHRWVRDNKKFDSQALENLRADIAVNEQGFVRLNYQDIVNAGLDLKGLKAYQIAVSHQGKGVQRRIVYGNKERVFSERSSIIFHADNVEGDLALYNHNNVYQVSANTELAVPVRRIKHKGQQASSQKLLRTIEFETDKLYMNASTSGSPWFEQSLGLGASPTLSKTFVLPSDYVPGTAVKVDAQLMGGFDFPHIEEDHGISISVNGTTVMSQTWGGIDTQQFSIEVPGDLVNSGANNIEFTAVNNQMNIALQHFDKFSVQYESEALVAGGTDNFIVEGAKPDQLISVRKNLRSPVMAFARDELGNIAQLQMKAKWVRDENGKKQRELSFATSASDSAEYWLLTRNSFVQPLSINVIDTGHEASTQADLYIVADASFATASLHNYMEFKRASGITTELVIYQDLIDQFGWGLNDPMAIQRFLKQQGAQESNAAVLIVGGHTYDYLDRTGQGSVSFIPTAYRPSSILQYSPTDTPLVDLDDDGMADVAIGRWPVRNTDQLDAIINKSIKWANGEGNANDSSVLLVAELDDPRTGVSFSGQLDEFASRFNNAQLNSGDYWSSVQRLYADDFSTVADQRAAIETSMNAGNSLTIFNGHGSPTSWSYKRIFDVNAAGRLEQNGAAGIIIPLACYTTYYETISNESLANKLLFNPDGGAVMIAGAATLGDYVNNGKMVKQIMRHQMRDQVTMGEAVKQAKRSMGSNNTQQANLWTLLGDPTLRFNATYQANDKGNTNSATVSLKQEGS